jgi:hypothetical protein
VPKLVALILAREADIVVGDRDVKEHEEFSPLKKALQSWGSWVVRRGVGHGHS